MTGCGGGVERRDAWGDQLAEPDSLGPPRAEHPAGDDPLVAGLGLAPAQVGEHGPGEHVGQLVGDAGQRVDHLVPHRADQPRSRAHGLGDDGRPPGHVGLAGVALGHVPAPRPEEPGDELDDGRVALERHVHHRGDGVAGDVVVGGTEPAAHDHAVGAGQGAAQGQDDPGLVVAHRLVEVGVHARRGQLLPEPGRVGVGDLAEEELGPDGDDLDPHPAARWAARRPSMTYWTPVKSVKATATHTPAVISAW